MGPHDAWVLIAPFRDDELEQAGVDPTANPEPENDAEYRPQGLRGRVLARAWAGRRVERYGLFETELQALRPEPPVAPKRQRRGLGPLPLALLCLAAVLLAANFVVLAGAAILGAAVAYLGPAADSSADSSNIAQ